MESFDPRNPDTPKIRSTFRRRLGPEQIGELHKLLDIGASHEALAEKYGISVGLVRSIADGRQQAAEYRRRLREGDPELRTVHDDRLRALLEQTQPVSDVIRRRIREHRQTRGMSLQRLADAMTERGFPLNKSQMSKVETGTEDRPFKIEELFAFADALRVPFVELVTPAPDEKPIRAGDLSLEGQEVADWLIRGFWGQLQEATTRIEGYGGTFVERLSHRAEKAAPRRT